MNIFNFIHIDNYRFSQLHFYSHGYAGRFQLALEKFFTGADLILHAGDVLNHGRAKFATAAE